MYYIYRARDVMAVLGRESFITIVFVVRVAGSGARIPALINNDVCV